MKTVLLCMGLFLLQNACTEPQEPKTPKHISKDYTLVWSDDFDGTSIDFDKWSYRDSGKTREFGVVTEENVYLDGKGNLVIEVNKSDSTYQIGQIGTQNTYLTKYGYFECRAKMNKELGPHVAFWLPSPLIHDGGNIPQEKGTEIDIFEYHTNSGTNIVYHNLHWGGYGEDHRSTGVEVEIEGVDEGFHTFGLEWTEDEYIFFVDGKETWRTTEAVSHIAEYMILSAELTGWGGNFSESDFPDKVIFDYVRVYKKDANK